MKRLVIVVAILLSSLFAIGPVFSQSQCLSGARWSLFTADGHLGAAFDMASSLGDESCTGANYNLCRQIVAEVVKAQDHVYQVFDQNYDSRNQCKKCGFGSAIEFAAVIRQWEDWLLARDYRSAYGVGNIHLTISQYADVPQCKRTGSGATGGAASGSASAARLPRIGGSYTCQVRCQKNRTGHVAKIRQNGDQLVFVNEGGQRSRGRFLNSTQVVATNWGNLHASVHGDGEEIRWSNGTVWKRQ